MTKKTAKVLNEHVAWLRFTGHGSFADGRMNRLVLCDSDDEGAFKVFRECTVREILEQGAAAMELAERQDKRIAELEAARQAERMVLVSLRLLREIVQALDGTPMSMRSRGNARINSDVSKLILAAATTESTQSQESAA